MASSLDLLGRGGKASRFYRSILHRDRSPVCGNTTGLLLFSAYGNNEASGGVYPRRDKPGGSQRPFLPNALNTWSAKGAVAHVSRLFAQLKTDHFFIVANVQPAVGQRRMRPGFTAHLRAGQRAIL